MCHPVAILTNLAKNLIWNGDPSLSCLSDVRSIFSGQITPRNERSSGSGSILFSRNLFLGNISSVVFFSLSSLLGKNIVELWMSSLHILGYSMFYRDNLREKCTYHEIFDLFYPHMSVHCVFLFDENHFPGIDAGAQEQNVGKLIFENYDLTPCFETRKCNILS